MEQDEGLSLYILLSGRVSVQRQTVSGRNVLIAERGPGEHFGEMSLLDGRGHSADVLALTDCELLIISRDAFAKTVTDHPSVALSVMRTLSGRLRELTADLTRSRSLDLMGRVCAALLDLANGQGVLEDITQKSLAARTGASREAVNRTLQNLQDAGYIAISKRIIRLLDRTALSKRADHIT